MVNMNPLAVSITILAILSATSADVSHLHQASNGGYHYANLGGLTLHSPESNPAPSQYIHGTYGDNYQPAHLPTSYVPPPSGSPFESAAPLPRTFADSATRLSVPLQSPLLASQKFQTQPTYQQYQTRSLQTPTYQSDQGQAQAQTPTYQHQAQATSTFNSAYTQTHAQEYARAYSQQNQEPIVTKHFYVHAAPEDPEEEAGPRFIPVGRPRKNYKIIFIKTPSYGLKSQIIPVLPRTEDKTIVYVLSKKPTFDQNIQLPEPAPTEPSKPDVFFIKYKTKEEAEQAQQSIQAAYDQANLAGSGGVDQIAAQFGAAGSGSNSNSDSSSSSFGGQDSQNYQQNQYGGQ